MTEAEADAFFLPHFDSSCLMKKENFQNGIWGENIQVLKVLKYRFLSFLRTLGERYCTTAQGHVKQQKP